MKSRLALLGVLISILLSGGCAAPIKKTALIPTAVASFNSTGKTILILPVVIRPQPAIGIADPIHSMPDADTYRDAIADTARNTGLFSDVRKNGNSDFSLSSLVIGERLIGTVSNISLFLIRYELSDMKTGNTIWSENVFSYSTLTATDIFAGYERFPKVIEAGIRANMKQLAAALGAALPNSAR